VDEDWLRLSLIEHYAYCPRQAALILDGAWEDNHLTVEGTAAHERVDHGPTDYRHGVKVHHSVDVACERLKVFGVADSIEEDADGVLCPVEHKRGRGAGDIWPSTAQVVAQALCLQEMTHQLIQEAAIYLASERRRVVVVVEREQSRVEALIREARATLFLNAIPLPTSNRKLCSSCSLKVACQPGEDLWM
jgi:CRISPR-associated exonuclease Cas4